MLVSHLNAIEQVLLAQSTAAQNAGHPNLRGGPREWFIRDFLESHLPSNLEIGQGEIIDENSRPKLPKGSYRPQVDIVIYRRDLPKITYSKENAAFLAEGVMATVESKSKLTFSELEKACMASKVHKSLTRSLPMHAFNLPPKHILAYVVAYDGPKKISTVAQWLPKIANRIRANPTELVEMIIVIGKGVIWRINSFSAFPITNVPQGSHWAFIEQNDKNIYAMFSHMLSWVSTTAAPPDTLGYATPVVFEKFGIV